LKPDDPVLHRSQVCGALNFRREPFAFRRQEPAVVLPT
jgi:hypothetical protein